MSYTPVREAFKRLENDGLLERIPNIGYLIPHQSNRDIIEIFQARECLETFVLEKVFSRLTDQDIERLEYYTEKQKEALDNENIKEFYEYDKRYHLLFFEEYGNPHLKEMIKNIRERYLLCSLITLSEGYHGISEAIKEHQQIIENIKKGDKKATLKSLKQNIKKSQHRLQNGNISIH